MTAPTYDLHVTLEQLYADTSRRTKIAEIERQLIADGVEHVYFQYVSVQGRVMAKVVPTEFWSHAAEKGLAWAYVVAGGMHVARNGDVVGSGGGATQEGLLLPDLDTVVVLPWDTRVARVFCTHYRRLDEDTAPGVIAADDCRALLRRALQQTYDDSGVVARSGCEPEMMWFRNRESIDGSSSHFPAHVATSYSVRHLEDVREVLARVTRYARAMGFPMIQADYEDPGQLECNFQFDDFLTTADRLVTYRQICTQVADELGMVATFMPKPVAGLMANGCHHNVSLWRGDENIFIDPAVNSRHNLTPEGLHAIGGLLTHSRGMMALLAPTVNSYKRFLDAIWSPSAVNWGYDNRAAAMRVVPGRIEVRPPDASTNPYLSHVAILAAMKDGIKNEVDPGEPLEGPIGAAVAAGQQFAPLPTTLAEALDALDDDEVIKSALTPELYRVFVDAKRDEWMRFCGAITEWDIQTYLNYIP
jgi:glutamine synthetase